MTAVFLLTNLQTEEVILVRILLSRSMVRNSTMSEQYHCDLMPEAYESGHEVVVWEGGRPVQGFMEGVSFDYDARHDHDEWF